MSIRHTSTLTLPIMLISGIVTSLQPSGAAHAVAERPTERFDTEATSRLTAQPTASATATPQVATQAAPTQYEVVPGDTVSSIATRFGLATASVLALNGLSWSTTIYPGQVLQLTSGTSTSAPAPAPPSTPAPAQTSHTVVAGETISGIAGRYGIATAHVLSANGLTPDSIIYPGQTIAIPAGPAPAVVPAAVVIPSDLTAEMAANAQTIIDTGRSLGVPDHGIVIALATAMQESSLRNLTYGHLDSLGLFQQRPSFGWGTPEQILDPVRSTLAFFGGSTNPNGSATRGLLDIPNWQSLSVTQAAQAVQVSAFPDAYARWEAPARTWLDLLG